MTQINLLSIYAINVIQYALFRFSIRNQTKICIDCNDMDEEIISIQDYLERIKNLSKEGNKCEKHEINALDICLNCQKWMCNKCN